MQTVNALLSTVILVSFIVTIVLAAASYGAYKLRERRKPRGVKGGPDDAPVFFERIFLGQGAAAAVIQNARAD